MYHPSFSRLERISSFVYFQILDRRQFVTIIHDNYSTCNESNLSKLDRLKRWFGTKKKKKKGRFVERLENWHVVQLIFRSPRLASLFRLSLAAFAILRGNFAVHVISLKGQCDFRTDGRRATFTYAHTFLSFLLSSLSFVYT